MNESSTAEKSVKMQPDGLLNRFTNQFVNKKVDPVIMTVYRILFAVLNIIVIIWYILDFDVIWISITNPGVRLFLQAVLFGWFLISIFLLLGIGGRWVGILQLLVSAFIMRNVYTYGIFELTHLVCSWIFIVARTDTVFSVNNLLLRSRKKWLRLFSVPFEHSSRLGVFIVGSYFGMIFLYSGLDKLIDPLWFYGNGFYVFSVLPWTLPPYLKGIADQKWLMIACNYITLIIEIGFLFFFLFRKTRFVAVVGLLALSIGLVWPFNIFLIGDYAVIFSLCLFAICDIPFGRKRKSVEMPPGSLTLQKKKRLFYTTFAVLGILALIEISSMYTVFKKEYSTIKALPLPPSTKVFDSISQITPDTVTYAQGLVKNLGKLHLNEVRNPLTFVNTWFIGAFQVGLFSSKHLIGLYAYRIIIKKKDGSIVEPIKYYHPDLYRGNVSSNFFRLNIYHSAMYTVSDFCFKLTRNMKPDPSEFFYRFFEHSLSETDPSKAVSVSMLVAPMNVPFEMQGSLKQVSVNWKEILRYDVQANKYQYIEMPERMPFQARNPDLPDYFPKYQWDKILRHNK